MNKDIINFGAGPAALPVSILEEASKAIINYNDTGLSILEIPHRESKLFEELLAESKSLVLDLAGLSANEYEVLWLQGGGRMQFAMIPMNFLAQDATAGYIDSGFWAHDAISHAQQFGKVKILGSTRSSNYTSLPIIPQNINEELCYVHLTTNNTIYGTQFAQIPNSSAPLIADMSSDVFSGQRDYSQFDMFYAVAQKNLGAAGNTLVVIKKNMLHKIARKLPPILDYNQQAIHHSVLNTPPVFGIFVSLLSLRWISQKGIAKLEQENTAKAHALYCEIERNTMLSAIVAPNDRSKMNVVFNAQNLETEQALITFCYNNGIVGIKGHRSVGGLRVSLYNAISMTQVQQLITVLQAFEKDKNKQ